MSTVSVPIPATTTYDARRDRARGLLVGVHAGDSLGATYEFGAAGGDSLPPHLDVVGGGPFGWAAGAPTDDTDLTWAVALGYRKAQETGRQLLPTVFAEMCRWARGPWFGRKGLPRDIGGATYRALLSFDPDTATQANGSLMRCAPGALIGTLDEAVSISELTHPNIICSAAVAAYITIARELIGGAFPDDAIRAGVRAAWFHEETADAVAETLDAKDPSDVYLIGNGRGEVVDSLVLACAAVRTAESFEDGVDHVIRWIGGDTDTNAAIAGGLLGAHFGLTGIPNRWEHRLRLASKLVAWADWAVAQDEESDHGRPTG